MVFLLSVQPSYSQDVPASADPSRFIESLGRDRPPETDDTAVPQEAIEIRAEAPEGAESYTFILKEVRLNGVTAYAAGQIAPLYEHMIGQTISIADVYNVAAEITRQYRADGFILAEAIIPPQEVNDGVITINVVEGRIHEVMLEGLGESPDFLIESTRAQIQQATAFNVYDLERWLLLLNRITGLHAIGVLAPVEDPDAPPGAVALQLLFSPRSNQYTLSLDNYGSNYVGPWQAGASVRIPHATLMPGITDFSLYTSPQTKELGFVSLSETVPLTASGLIMNASIKYSRSEPGGSLESLDLNSHYLSLGFGLEYPLYLKRAYSLDIFGRFEYNNSKSDILSTRFYDDKLRVLRLGLRGNHGNVFWGQFYGETAFSQGLDIFCASKTGSIDLSRAEGHSNFTKLDARLTHLKRIDENIGLKNILNGQYAFTPLLSSEEFGYGGYNLGRGYNNSEITGDSGVGFLTELSYQKWEQYKGGGLTPGVTPFVYYDIGKVWNRDNNVNPESGASAGLGFTLNWGDSAELRLTLAQPLSRKVQNPSYGDGKAPNALISFRSSF